MAFSESVVKAAWMRANGKCECARVTCGHVRRCNKQLVWENRGKEGCRGAWEAHHVTAVSSGGADICSNCQILCLDCHKNTRSYGSH